MPATDNLPRTLGPYRLQDRLGEGGMGVVHLARDPEGRAVAVKVLLDAYAEGKFSAVYLCYTRFINTIKQEPVVQQLLPLSAASMSAEAAKDASAAGSTPHSWDYLYEPDAPTVIDELLVRYAEALVYQAVAENMASEHSARMVAMKAATDNAGNLIAELKLIYNRTRQAAITKELSEIVAGAAAV